MQRLAFALILVAAACTPLPPAGRGPYLPTSFEALPGWAEAKLEPSLRAFLAGCPRAGGALISACALASSVPPGDEAAARRFFESAFVPYALVSADGADTGLVTGYYEPLLRGSRTKSALYRYP